MNTKLLFKAIVTGFVAGVIAYGAITPLVVSADTVVKDPIAAPTLIHNGHLTICMLNKSSYQVIRTMRGKLTAYTNTVDQTDDTPNKTASGFDLTTLKPREGVVANNFLPIGTMVRIPDLFGDTIFKVEDRGSVAHFDSVNRFDVYIPGGEKGRDKAMQFGVKTATIEIIES